ncbi:polyphosphate kinase 2 [Chenggangzhangella methanolivorans]|uniref:ADP/GDP-polyphosphate phosphotransferase n=1 Tax=Chenggangzhangella methanolivorans TaxID=1437009 RepID=A0A9E6UM25_9HYPH|nr:polyphosphate kinase 2 [Chenggangzhangella methanolivorans]QZN98743.1 polyphosphate kinase 2 [Chenggangzhangella methanolivorans]
MTEKDAASTAKAAGDAKGVGEKADKVEAAPATEAVAAPDPTDAVAPEGMEDAPAVTIDGVTVDLDDRKLPKEVDKQAFASGGYPYEDKLDDAAYEAELRNLQIELLKLQAWVKKTGERVAILFEGRDSAGKGGTIARITQHMPPRSVRVVALSKPSPSEAGQWYFQRYIQQMPTAGEIVLFDRSWYNRAGVEPVMGFSSPTETARFLEEAPQIEKLLVGDGLRLFKFWLTVGREMQIKRLHERRHDPLKRWKLSPIDYAGLNLWDAYSEAADRMLRASDSPEAPWTVVKANDKKRLRLAVMRKILLAIPYKGRDLQIVGGLDGRLVMGAEAFLAEGGER